MEEKKKKKSGNDYLKEKIAKLEADKAKLNGVIDEMMRFSPICRLFYYRKHKNDNAGE